jgi:hypothetical protein
MILRVLKRTFWIFYDNLLKGMIINFVTFIFLNLLVIICVASIKERALAVLAAAILSITAWNIGGLGIMSFWIKEIRCEDNRGAFKEIMAGIKNLWLQGLAITGINSLFAVLAYVSFEFYKSVGAADTGFAGKFSIFMAGLGLCIIFIFLVMQVYVMPILALDEKKRVFTSYKKAFIMSFSAPVSSPLAMLFIAALVFPVFMFVFGLPGNLFYGIPMILMSIMPFISFIIIVLLQLNSTFLVYEKHKIFTQDLVIIWEDKSLKNLFRPWEPRK